MEPRKLLTCLHCDAPIELALPVTRDQVVCSRCRQGYDLEFLPEERVWILRPQEPVEPRGDAAPLEEEPFLVLNEVGRPAPEDRSEEHREQTDLHTDEEIAVSKPARKS